MTWIRPWGIAPEGSEKENYYCTEFQLKGPQILFQFKLRKTEEEPMFVLVKQGSRVLEGLKQGDVLPMTFHYQDRAIPGERKMTLVKSVMDGDDMGFRNHFVVALDPAVEKNG